MTFSAFTGSYRVLISPLVSAFRSNTNKHLFLLLQPPTQNKPEFTYLLERIVIQMLFDKSTIFHFINRPMCYYQSVMVVWMITAKRLRTVSPWIRNVTNCTLINSLADPEITDFLEDWYKNVGWKINIPLLCQPPYGVWIMTPKRRCTVSLWIWNGLREAINYGWLLKF